MLAVVRDRFDETHERRYGYRIADAVMELVQVNAVAVEGDPIRLDAALGDAWGEAGATARARRAARLLQGRGLGADDDRAPRRPAAAATRLEGPAIVEEIDSTTLVLQGQTATVDASASLIITEHGASEEAR